MALDGLDREHVYDLFEKAVKDYICKFPAGSSEGVRWAHLASLSASVDCTVRCCYPVKSIRPAIGKIGVHLLLSLFVVFS